MSVINCLVINCRVMKCPYTLFDALVGGEPPHPGAQNFVTKN